MIYLKVNILTKLYVLLPLCMFYNVLTAAIFDTLSDIIQYTKILPEFPQNESFNPYRQRYDALYMRLKGSKLDFFLSRLKLKQIVDINDFEKELYSVTIDRELQGYMGDCIIKVDIKSKTSWYIWGSLYGAFHSLVRALDELYKKKMIDNNLHIIHPTTYLVFNGNLTGYAPYSLEVLMLIIKLLYTNPSQVFVTKGYAEQTYIWKQYTLKNELDSRFKRHSYILEQYIDRFFNTLPLSIYLIDSMGKILSIANSELTLPETTWHYFFTDKTKSVEKANNIEPSDKKSEISAKILSLTIKEVPYRITKHGLMNEKKGDTFIWTIFSSPVGLFKSMFDIHNDIFVMLTTDWLLESWRLTLFAQDIHERHGFMRAHEFDVETGKELYTIFPAKRIKYLEQEIEAAKFETKVLTNECAIKQHQDLMSVDVSQERPAAPPVLHE